MSDARPVLRPLGGATHVYPPMGGVTAQPSPEIMAQPSPTKECGPPRWGLPDSVCLPDKPDAASRPNSASSSDTSSSSEYLSAERSEVKLGYDPDDMAFILGGKKRGPEEDAASHVSYRRQMRRQFGMTQIGLEDSVGMETGSVPVPDDENIYEQETDEADDEMIVKDDGDDDDDDESKNVGWEDGWISDEAETEKPPKRIKTSTASESESESDSESESEDDVSENGGKSDGEDEKSESENDREVPDMSAFFDDAPVGPIKLSAAAIEEYTQDDYAENKYKGFSSTEVEFDSFFNSLPKRCDSDSDSNDDDFCISCFSKSAGIGYAFPRVTPRSIELVVKFWENDFQVGDYVYPNMGSWDSKGIAPNRNDHPAADCRKYGAYKSLYTKWAECNKSRDQWYSTYRGHSLVQIANGRVNQSVRKQKTDSTFRSICAIDISTGLNHRSTNGYLRRAQKSNPNKRSHFGGISMVY